MTTEESSKNIGFTTFSEQININLFNDVIAFVMATTSVNTGKVYSKLNSNHLWFFRSENKNIQAQYGFRYFGELLERLENEPDIRDIRALALAMAYVKDLLTDDMFIGEQKAKYISKIKRMSVSDTYLKGALYLLLKDESSADKMLGILTRGVYSRTEELVFVLSLYDDFGKGFFALKAQLLKLLGREKTIGLIANSELYVWLVGELCNCDEIKENRAKDLALLRAFMELPVAFVKPDSRHHKVLLENGYTPEDILFINSFILRYSPTYRTIDTDSITAEKIAVEMMVAFIKSENTHPPEVFEHLEYLLKKYSSFAIKIMGYKGIYEAIENRISIKNPQTFVWLYNKFKNKDVFIFDIMDEKWDSLSKDLTEDEYRDLFSRQLINNCEQTGEQLNERIRKYDELTGQSYVRVFELEYCWSRDSIFKLLVDKSVINLNEMFSAHIINESKPLEGDKTDKSSLFFYFHNYLKGIRTRQAFDFIKSFFIKYSLGDMKNYFSDNMGHRYDMDSFFLNELYHEPLSRNHHNYYEDKKNDFYIKRDFLSDDEHREIFSWIDDYMFQYKAENYFEYSVCVLLSDFISTLFPHNELRRIFDMVAGIDDSHFIKHSSSLKKMFLTADEQQAEEDAKKALKEKTEQDEAIRRTKELKEKMDEIYDGSFKSILAFLDSYRYSLGNENIFLELALEHLPVALKKANNRLCVVEFVVFLQLCERLVKKGKLSFGEAKKYISSVEEAEKIVEND